jgi:xylulose-5-phosphate/fructose-6-phosphate phosphoketolase
MVVFNKMSRFHLTIDALKRVPRLRLQVSDAIDVFNRKLYEDHACNDIAIPFQP